MTRRTWLDRVEIVAGAGMWIAIGVASYLAATRPERPPRRGPRGRR